MSVLEQERISLDGCTGTLLLNESLDQYTTWRVGGPALRLYKPSSIDDLSLFLKQHPAKEPLLFLGLGSNTLIRDQGFKGTVIVTQAALKEMTLVTPQRVEVQAGVSCASMARFCARNQLAGAEFWAGIPGTMGGALRMNAGCHGGETWQHLRSVQTVTASGLLRHREPKEFEIAYRHVAGLNDEYFVSAVFEFPVGDKELSLQIIKDLLARRAQTQPTSEYNCGSVFRNPEGHFAAALIEGCGLKGFRLGGARVSEKHANFIINDAGQAKSSDIEDLIQLVHTKVYEEKGVLLVPEVHIIGER